MGTQIRTEALNFWYGEDSTHSIKRVLKDINVKINEGEFVAVLGHNGSGKSTLAKHFNAILLPMGGKVYVGDYDTKDDSKLIAIRQKVGMVFQNPDNQIVATVVEEDVAFAPENLGLPPAEIRKRVDYALKAVGMYDYREHAAHLLSGGQKQRVAIAGVIAMRPDVIVLDEPTAMLDPSGRSEVLKTIKKLCTEEKISIVLITHYMNEAAIADRILVMHRGRIKYEGTPRQVFSKVSEMHEIGLEVPQVTELAYRLSQRGFEIDSSVITVDECVEALLHVLEDNKFE